jgi:hypothetical protein
MLNIMPHTGWRMAAARAREAFDVRVQSREPPLPSVCACAARGRGWPAAGRRSLVGSPLSAGSPEYRVCEDEVKNGAHSGGAPPWYWTADEARPAARMRSRKTVRYCQQLPVATCRSTCSVGRGLVRAREAERGRERAGARNARAGTRGSTIESWRHGLSLAPRS